MDMIGDRNLRKMWEELAELYKNKPAFIWEGIDGLTKCYSYHELNCKINQASNLFLQLGVKKGDKVAVQLHNCPEFIFTWFGLAKIGAIIVPLNIHFLKEECSFIIKKCSISTVVTEESFINNFKDIDSMGASLSNLCVARNDNFDANSNKSINFNLLLESQSSNFLCEENISSSDIAEILFTSGTTSHPKGVVITHHNLCFAGYYTAWQAALRSDDVYLTMMPTFHIDCQCTAIMPTFVAGATLVLLEKYSSKKFWSQICLYRATVTECLPIMVRTLLMQPVTPWEKNHNLREVFFYLNLSDSEKDTFLERFNVRFLTSYGMTETIVGIIGDRPGDKRKWPSMGRVGMNYEAKIVDDDGSELLDNEPGELWIKGEPGKTIFLEYFNEPEKTGSTLFEDGWLRTGDCAYRDSEGFFYFVDRNVNIIKRSGENISCTEVENAITSHPSVLESAVVGIFDAIHGETVKAFVVCKENKSVSADELKVFLSSLIAKFKLPEEIEFCESLPRTCTGKVQKYLLKEGNEKERGLKNHQSDEFMCS